MWFVCDVNVKTENLLDLRFHISRPCCNLVENDKDENDGGSAFGPSNAKVKVTMAQPTTSTVNRKGKIAYYLTPKPNMKNKYKNNRFITHSHHMSCLKYTFKDDEDPKVMRMYPTVQQYLDGSEPKWSFGHVEPAPVDMLPVDLLDDLIGCPILFGWEYDQKIHWFKLFDGC